MRCLKWYMTVGTGKARASQEQTMRYTHMRHLREESDGYRKCKAEGQCAHHGVDGQVHARVRLQKLCPVMSDTELARNQKQFCAQPHTHIHPLTHTSTRPHTHPPAHTHTSTRPYARSTHSFILSWQWAYFSRKLMTTGGMIRIGAGRNILVRAVSPRAWKTERGFYCLHTLTLQTFTPLWASHFQDSWQTWHDMVLAMTQLCCYAWYRYAERQQASGDIVRCKYLPSWRRPLMCLWPVHYGRTLRCLRQVRCCAWAPRCTCWP